MGTTTTALVFKNHDQASATRRDSHDQASATRRDSHDQAGAARREYSELTIGHVGDSRCYLFRPLPDGDLLHWQLTRDHSLVQDKLRAGLIKREEIATDRMKNVITRSVGFESDVQVETYHFAAHPGDMLLICSDGLSGLIQDDEMCDIIRETYVAPKTARPVPNQAAKRPRYASHR